MSRAAPSGAATNSDIDQAGVDQIDPDQSVAPAGGAPSASETSALDDFIYLVSHDLRASMRALLEVPEWIAEDLADAGIALPASVKEHMALLDRHTSRLDRMLCDLLAYSRVGRRQDVVPVDVEKVLDQVLEEAVLPEGWQVRRDLEHDLLEFGQEDIMTLFHALVSNAVKHHDAAAGEISIRTRRQGDKFVLTVTDDGPGIPADQRRRVFDVMRTLRSRDQIEGSGMGLAIVAKLAKTYCGCVSAEAPSGGRGATIRFIVPALYGAGGLAA